MKIKDILLKPLITEKANNLAESKLKKYVFKVSIKATKKQIKDAIEKFYEVKVQDVNTLIVAAKTKSKMTKKGVFKGQKSSFKKAIITLPEGKELNLYNEIV